jgi:hypothetical protein
MIFKVFEGSYSVLELHGTFWLGPKYVPKKNGRILSYHVTCFSVFSLVLYLVDIIKKKDPD